MIDTLVEQWQQQSMLEVIAFILSVAYVFLAARQNIWCWLCAFISTTIYVYLFYSVSLPFHSLLNAYYIVMAGVGFVSWRKGQAEAPLKVRELNVQQHAMTLSIGTLISFLLVIFAAQWFDSTLLWLDAPITVFSVFATLMTARKYIDSWSYWLVLNTAAAYLFFQSGLYLTTLLMLIYTVMAVYGLIEWRKSLNSVIIT